MATKPKLALIPSGYGANKVYSVLPSNGDGDFDFSRSGQATRVNKDGLIETVGSNIPRLNYPMIDGVVSGCPSLLLENSATNILNYSEDFSQSYWAKSNSSIISNQVISPDGTLNASKFVEGTSNGVHKIVKPYTGISGTNTCSIFVKPDGVTKIGISSTESVSVLSSFDLSDGTLISSFSDGYSITFFPNGWFRISSTDIGGNRKMAVFLLDDNGNYTYQGDGTSGVYIWGAQLEQGSYPTSYIPTPETSSSTRLAETCNGAGTSDTFSDNSGVLMAEILFNLEDNYPNLSIFNNTNANKTDNKIVIYKGASNSNQISVALRSGGSEYANITANVNVENYNKIAISYKANEVKYYLNGFLIDTDNTVTVPIGLDTLNFDNGAGVNDVYGNTKQIQYFDTTLTDSELEQLTSWVSFNEMAQAQLYKTY